MKKLRHGSHSAADLRPSTERASVPDHAHPVLDHVRSEASAVAGTGTPILIRSICSSLQAGQGLRRGVGGARSLSVQVDPCHGHRELQFTGTFGTERVRVTRARIEYDAGKVTEWRSKALRRYQRLAIVYVMTSILTQLVTNKAVAVLMRR